MKYLLDTHTLLWWHSDLDRLSPRARDCCEDIQSTVLISVASAWEIQIKQQAEKLHIGATVSHIFQRQVELNGMHILSVELRHVAALTRLPTHHRDPFDRILLAQAIVEDATIISKDKLLSNYNVNVIW